ncbi:MAG: flagellar assembly protein FliW [Planctomycetes bacterium]|nr:flagellar assembly protein FliW [Planctomycetota bacterium]
MMIQTSRFGGIEVDDQRFLNFPKGLLGFPDDREYALIQTGEDSAFYWMQAVHRPELAFVVCDPRCLSPTIASRLRAKTSLRSALPRPADRRSSSS